MSFAFWSRPVVAVDQVDVAAGYEGISEQAAKVPGLSDEQADLGSLRALWQRQVQHGPWHYSVAASGEAGASQRSSSRFANVTLRPQVKAEFNRQIHHLELTGSWSYDQLGLLRRPLSEQSDNVFLTPAQRQRHRYGAVGSDHFFEFAPRVNGSLYLFASYLDQGLITKSYGGGGYVEYVVNEDWRVRLGATDQLFFFDRASIRSQGPDVSTLLQATPTCSLELKAALITVTDAFGNNSHGVNGKAVLQDERGDFGARLAWEKGTMSREVTSELTTSDTYSVVLHGMIDRQNGLEFAADQRLEEWAKGFPGTTPADSLKAELRYIYQTGGASWWLPGRGAWNTVAAYASEQLRTKAGQSAARQVIRFSLERVL